MPDPSWQEPSRHGTSCASAARAASIKRHAEARGVWHLLRPRPGAGDGDAVDRGRRQCL